MNALTALLGFTAWTLLLIFAVVSYRTFLVFLRGQPANSWTRGQATSSPPLVTRAEHAHMNCVENLPVFAAIVLAAYAMGKPAVADSVAAWVLYARLAQSTTHLIGTSHWLVVIRALLYTLQVLLFFCMLWRLLA